MVVGKTTSGRRDRFYLATKVRVEGKEAGEAQLAEKSEGKIGMVGVTAMVPEAYPEIMDLMRADSVDAVQIPYNVVQTEAADELRPLAQDLGIGILTMEP